MGATADLFALRTRSECLHHGTMDGPHLTSPAPLPDGIKSKSQNMIKLFQVGCGRAVLSIFTKRRWICNAPIGCSTCRAILDSSATGTHLKLYYSFNPMTTNFPILFYILFPSTGKYYFINIPHYIEFSPCLNASLRANLF